MRASMKAALWLAATFAAGTAFGMVLNGAIAHGRPNAPPPPPGPSGFVGEMERIIQPRDDAQRDAIRPFLENTDRINRSIVDGARASMGAALDSMRTALAPHLDPSQKQRLSEFGGPPHGDGVPGMNSDPNGRGAPPEFGRGRGGRGEPMPPGAPPQGPPGSRPPNAPPPR